LENREHRRPTTHGCHKKRSVINADPIYVHDGLPERQLRLLLGARAISLALLYLVEAVHYFGGGGP
jgi:hypothetical protein